MALTANRDVKFYASMELVELGVDDSAVIYKGALVGRNRATGYARGLVAGDEFLGVAYEKADNTISGHSAGGVLVKLHQAIDVVHALAGVAAGDVGKDVYASADDALTLTPTGNSRVGRVVAVESSGVARVRCQPVLSATGVAENWPLIQLSDASQTLSLDHMNRTLLIANTAARTLTLPAAATVRAGGWFRLVKTSSDAFAVTIDPNASETIDGSATLGTLDAANDTALVLCTGSAWIVLSRDIA